MKKILLLLVFFGFFVSNAAMAEQESPRSICVSEAEDSGFESASEKEAYIADCIQQVSQEMGISEEQNMEEKEESGDR